MVEVVARSRESVREYTFARGAPVDTLNLGQIFVLRGADQTGHFDGAEAQDGYFDGKLLSDLPELQTGARMELFFDVSLYV